MLDLASATRIHNRSEISHQPLDGHDLLPTLRKDHLPPDNLPAIGFSCVAPGAGCFRLAQARHREIAESDGLRLSGFPGWPDNRHRHGAGHAPFGVIPPSAISTNWRA